MPRALLAKRLYDDSDGLPPERAINCYAQRLPEDGTQGNYWKLTPVPGNGTTKTTIAAACRALFYDKGNAIESDLLAVFGTDLYTIDSAFAATDVGNVASSTRRAIIVPGKNEILILSATTAYSWNGTTLTTVVDADAPTFEDIANLGGRFLGVNQGTIDIKYSDLNVGTSWTANGYISAEYAPDEVTAICVNNDTLYAFGNANIERFRVTSDTSSPYQRAIGAVTPVGCPARDSVVRVDGGICFVGNNRFVNRIDGLELTKISKPWIDKKIEALSSANLALIECSAFVYRGQTFLQLDLPGDGTYWFNFATGEWNERATASATLAAPRVYPDAAQRQPMGFAFDVAVAGGRTANLLSVSGSEFTDPGGALVRAFTALIPSDRGGFPVDTVALTCTPGRTASGSPVITLKTSTDGGQTLSTGLDRSMGQTGEYDEPVIWQGLGMCGPQGMLCQFSTSAAAAFDVTACRYNEPIPF